MLTLTSQALHASDAGKRNLELLDLSYMNHTQRRTTRRSTMSKPTSANTASDNGDVNEPPHNFDETIATLRSTTESVIVRVLQKTADEQARVIQSMRSSLDAKDLRIQKLNRKIARRDKRMNKLRKRMERADMAFSRVDWSKSEAMKGIKHGKRMKVSPALTEGLYTNCGENCIHLVRENQELRNRLHSVDGLCIRLRTECGNLENKIRGLESQLDEIRG
ncbi:hypothetical protein NHQ30_005003 [Ciborinia camelliae]|nr:hypothetical protein NHQ30_005003 [Ciborinia camelliae]